MQNEPFPKSAICFCESRPSVFRHCTSGFGVTDDQGTMGLRSVPTMEAPSLGLQRFSVLLVRVRPWQRKLSVAFGAFRPKMSLRRGFGIAQSHSQLSGEMTCLASFAVCLVAWPRLSECQATSNRLITAERLQLLFGFAALGLRPAGGTSEGRTRGHHWHCWAGMPVPTYLRIVLMYGFLSMVIAARHGPLLEAVARSVPWSTHSLRGGARSKSNFSHFCRTILADDFIWWREHPGQHTATLWPSIDPAKKIWIWVESKYPFWQTW